MAKTTGRDRTPERQVAPLHLVEFDRDRIESGRDYDGTAFVGLDFTGQDASDARFVECRIERCCIDGLKMRRARLVECLVADVHGATLDLADSTWRESVVTGSRLGALLLPGASLTGIRFGASKLGFANLAGATLDDVVFEGCEIESIDARTATLRSVAFIDCVVGELNVAEATLSKVDLSGARLRTLVGVESLRGAIVSHEQLLDLAPQLAAQLGLEVRADESRDGDEGW